MKELTPRDKTKSADYYLDWAAEQEKRINGILENGPVILLGGLPRDCRNVALACYCAGESPTKCRKWFAQSADCLLKFWQVKSFHLPDYWGGDEELILLSAAFLGGKASVVVTAFRSLKFDRPPVPRVRGVMEQYCALLMNEPTGQNEDEMRDIEKKGRDWITLPPLFKAVGERDQEKFAGTLESYLAKSWSKAAKNARSVLRYPHLTYLGCYSLLAAALSQMMDNVPALPAQLRDYIPVDLITGKKPG